MKLQTNAAKERVKKTIEACTVIDAAVLARERALMMTKWFDYRFLSPWKATFLFAQEYQKAFREHFAESIDRDQAGAVSGLKLDKILSSPRERTQLWLARQRADEAGIPYNLYITWSLEFAARRQRNKIPRPNQLHHSDNRPWVAFRDAKWKELVDDRLVSTTHVAYRVENYRHFAAQDAHRQFLLKQAASSQSQWRGSMSLYALQRRQLELDDFAAVVPADIYVEELAAIRSQSAVNADPLPATDPSDLWPSCFGIPAARDETCDPCASCSGSTWCGALAARVTSLMTAGQTPSDRKRQGARDRQRKHRRQAKERAAAQVVSA